MAAGVLEEHGIEAWVWGDLSSSGYGVLMNAGCQLMVDEEDVPEAAAVLNALPAPLPDAGGKEPPALPRGTAGQAIVTGVVAGAMNAPVLMFGWVLFLMVMVGLRKVADPRYFIPAEYVPSSLLTVGLLVIQCVAYGALLGALGGWFAWLLGDFRRGGSCGRCFVWFITMTVALPQVLFMLVLLLVWLVSVGALHGREFIRY